MTDAPKKPAATRIYVVHQGIEAIALVRAASQAQAIRHATANRYGAFVAGQEKLVELIGEGLKVEDAKAEAEPSTTENA